MATCGELLFLSFSAASVILLIIKYLILFIALFLCIYGLYATTFGTAHKIDQFKSDPLLNKLLIFSLCVYIISIILTFLTTMFSSIYNYADTKVSMFDESIVDTNTVIDDIDDACNIKLKHIEQAVDTILVVFGVLQFTCVIVIYIARLLIEFKDSSLAITSTNRKILYGLLITFIILALASAISVGIERGSEIGLTLSAIAYLLYIIAMGYTCRLYFKKLSQSSKVEFEMKNSNDNGNGNGHETIDDIGGSGNTDNDNNINNGGGSMTNIFADSATVDRIAMYAVTAVVAYASSILGVLFSVLMAVAGGDENSVLELLQGIGFSLDGLCNLLAILWQFGIGKRWYDKCCGTCHEKVERKCANKVVN